MEQNRYTTKHHAILSRIDHMEKVEKPGRTRALTSGFDSGGHAAKEIVSFKDASKAYGAELLFGGVSAVIRRNDRIALVGANGCGKTTLMKIIMGDEQPDSGEVKVSANVKFGYMPQIIAFDNMNATVLETFRGETGETEAKARSVLARFNFMAEDILKKVRSLSGGEKSRLKLCLLMQRNINFLMLDEPTNHLDIASREWIEAALDDFEGTMLFISHDRYFLNRFADTVWSMENGAVTEYSCGFDEYAEQRLTPYKGYTKKERGKPVQAEKKAREKVIPYEELIRGAEAELDMVNTEIESELAKQEFSRMEELHNRKNELTNRIDELYGKWLDGATSPV